MAPTGADLAGGLEFVGVGAFALSGALAAAGRRGDVAVVCVAAVATGLAGGTLGDIVIGTPVFWLDRPIYLAACLVAAGAIWAVGLRPWSGRALLWFDAVGLSALAVAGVARAAAAGVSPLAAATVGMMTAMVAGLVRDGFARQPPLMLGRELYLAAAAAGVMAFVLLRLMQTDQTLAALAGTILAFCLRAGALRYGWTLSGPPDRE